MSGKKAVFILIMAARPIRQGRLLGLCTLSVSLLHLHIYLQVLPIFFFSFLFSLYSSDWKLA